MLCVPEWSSRCTETRGMHSFIMPLWYFAKGEKYSTLPHGLPLDGHSQTFFSHEWLHNISPPIQLSISNILPSVFCFWGNLDFIGLIFPVLSCYLLNNGTTVVSSTFAAYSTLLNHGYPCPMIWLIHVTTVIWDSVSGTHAFTHSHSLPVDASLIWNQAVFSYNESFAISANMLLSTWCISGPHYTRTGS